MPEKPAVSQADVNAVLDETGVPHSHLGYHYLMQAIFTVCSDEKLMATRKVMQLYSRVAEMNNVSPSRIERDIRRALQKANCAMTSGEFIYRVSDQLCCRDPSA